MGKKLVAAAAAAVGAAAAAVGSSAGGLDSLSTVVTAYLQLKDSK